MNFWRKMAPWLVLVMLHIFPPAASGGTPGSDPVDKWDTGTAPVPLPDGLSPLNLKPYLEYFREKERSFTVADIRSRTMDYRFKPMGNLSGFGYRDGEFWFRFRIHNPSQKTVTLFFEYAYPIIDHFAFYHPLTDNAISATAGDSHPFNIRPVSFRTIIVPLEVPRGTHTFYFTARSRGAIVISARIWSREGFFRYQDRDRALNWIYIGIMAVTAVYCLFVFLAMKEIVFVHLGVFVLSIAVFTLTHTGMAFQYFWPESVRWANLCHPISGSVGASAGLIFTRSFLNTRDHGTWLNLILKWLSLTSLAVAGMSFFLPYRIATQTMVILCGTAGSAMLFSGLSLWLKRERQALAYLIGLSPIAVNAVVMGFRSFGLFESSFWVDSSLQITTALVAVLLSLGLLDKINTIRRERESAMARMQRSDQRYRLLEENVRDVIWLLDLTRMELVYTTPSIEEMTGYTSEEARHFSFKKRLPPESAARAVAAIKKGMAGPESGHQDFTIQLEFFTREGQTIWTETAARFLNYADGRPREMIGVTRDITERKRAEAERQALEFKLHQSGKLQAIGTLAGGIAHDMNNIVAAILGYAELTIGEADAGSRTYHRLDRIINACYRARDLVRQILTFSRQDNEDSRILKINLVVKEAMKLIRASLPATINIRYDIPKEGLMVVADPTQVHRIVMNLCANAGYAMAESGGVLGVTLDTMVLDRETADKYMALAPGNYVRLTVSDTGSGMEKEVLDRVFEPFFTTKPVGSGTGMGLSMVHGIIKKMGGGIHVYSEPGKGTTFHLFFPMADQKSGSESDSVSNGFPVGNETILYLDDEPDVVDMAHEMLSGIGYRVHTATDSRQALEWFRANPQVTDLVITDQTMPEMTGVDFAREIWRIRPGLPVILCTGFNDLVTPKQAREIGIRKYVMKPYSKRDIACKIREALAEKPLPGR